MVSELLTAAQLAVSPLVEEARQTAPRGGVWVSLSKADDVSKLKLGAPQLTAGDSALYHLSEDDLPRLSHHMHEEFGRCGGFFAYDSRREAESNMAPMAARSAGPYTVDQQAVVKPLVARAGEAGIRAVIDKLASYHNRYYQAATGVEAAQWLKGHWASLHPRGSAELVTHSGWKQPSVVLTIPGGDKADEIVVLGGHLDSIAGWGGSEKARAPGADDNASGIAALTEALRVLGEADFRPRRTIQFMGYAAEEVGLRGSNDIARRYARDGKKVVGVLQLDMTNFPGSGEGIWVLSDNVDLKLSEFLGELVEAYAGVKRGTTKCGYGCSDHASWNRAGFPASAAFEAEFNGMNRSIHTERDTLSNAGGDARHSVPFARLAAAFAVELAKPANASASAPSGAAR